MESRVFSRCSNIRIPGYGDQHAAQSGLPCPTQLETSWLCGVVHARIPGWCK